jgi:4'-phosphopantetheinyl transferase
MPDVWHAALDPEPDRLRELDATLSSDERERAGRFRFERDRRRFVAARGTLREVLGSRSGTEPAALRFEYGEHGKPVLRPEHGGGELFFNVAHSGDRGTFAVGSVPGIGIDVEVVRTVRDAGSIATRFFSRQESAAIAALPPALRLQAFFLCWTRKEAFIKALGKGLSHSLDAFAVSVAPGEPARLLYADPGVGSPDEWRLHDLSDLPAFACAVAVRGDPGAVRVGRWTGQEAVARTVT